MTKHTGKTALISVSDKTGVVEFARQLQSCGMRLLSTGGTAAALREAGLEVLGVSDYTGFPEIMAGRVKTLHPRVHGGILGRRDIDAAVMQEHGIDTIDLVVVNLYPFAETIRQADCTYENAVENIDIGGPAMIRAAAKNHQYVAVVTDPGDYTRVAEQLSQDRADTGLLTPGLMQQLAAKAFAHTAQYDAMIANYLQAETTVDPQSADTPQAELAPQLPPALSLTFEKQQDMRYGENPHQQAAFYIAADRAASSIANAELMQGKALSFNNIADADAALSCVKEFETTTCVIVKHANPCGVASAENALQAYERAYACDPTSAFGGIIAFNQPVDDRLTAAILERQFVEVLLAPGYSAAALKQLATKPAIRALKLQQPLQVDSGLRYTSVSGGLLVQSADNLLISNEGLKTVTDRQPSSVELEDLLFAWRVAKYVKSNAIVYAKNSQSIGVGAGQMSRVYSARIAAIKAADESLDIKQSVLASDAFFPFRDGIDSAAAAGVSAVIQPGGSRNDSEVIDAANEHNIAMVFTGMRHFRH